MINDQQTKQSAYAKHKYKNLMVYSRYSSRSKNQKTKEWV